MAKKKVYYYIHSVDSFAYIHQIVDTYSVHSYRANYIYLWNGNEMGHR